jgi:Polyketide cyclase / dehydrase and lipid transport
MSWWIVHGQHTLAHDVAASPSAVRDFYVDLENLKLVHPLIVSVQAQSRVETPGGYSQSYRVVDRIPLGPLTIRTSYAARLNVRDVGDVLTEADQWPAVRLRATVTFEPIDAGTRVVECIDIAAPRLLAATTTREALKAHTAMLAGIAHHFGSG